MKLTPMDSMPWSRNQRAVVTAAASSNGRRTSPRKFSRSGTSRTRWSGTMRSGFTQK
jgi:hypothetical protein